MEWKPHPRQADFLSLPDTIFEAMYGGAAGGGKSETLLNLPLVRGFHQHPRFKGILFRRTFPELEAELILRSEAQGLYKACGATYNKEKKRWTFPSGGTMNFGHIEYDSDVRKYDSAEYNYVGFDELTSFTEYMYLYMFSRCRSSSPKLPAIIRSGTNPGNVGHAWVRGRFVEVAPPNTIILDSVTKLKRIFIPCKAQDNPYLMEADPQYINVLMGMAEKDRRAKLDGDWYTFSGQVFDDYREERYENEPEFAVHVVNGFPIPDWWPRLLAIDWGFSAMCCALWGAVSPEGRLYVYREQTWKQKKISEWGADIARLSQGEKISDVVICQSASQQRGDELTISEQFANASGLRPRLSGNLKGSRVSGKLLVQEYLRWRAKPNRSTVQGVYDEQTGQRILRNEGLEKYKNYLASFQPEASESNLPKMQIFRDCLTLRKTIPLCVYDDDKKEDVAEFSGDDPYDTLRYLCRMVEEHQWGNLYNKQEALVTRQRIVDDFEQNKDTTSFYRRMRHLELTDSSGIKPISTMKWSRVARPTRKRYAA